MKKQTIITIVVGALWVPVSARLGAVLQREDRQLLDPLLEIPFDAGAFDFIGFSDSNALYGNCPLHDVVDGNIVTDPICISRGAECYIGYTTGADTPGFAESVSYYVQANKPMFADFTFRVASQNPKKILIEIRQGGPPYKNKELTAPGRGWEDFEDVTWKNVELRQGTLFLNVYFMDGATNLCAISGKESGPLVIPFHAKAFDFERVSEESTEEHLGNCQLDSIVDGQVTDDEVCNNRGSECAVAFTTPGEDLVYSVKAPADVTVDPILRLSSKNKKRVYLEIEGVSGGMDFFTEGGGFDKFIDYRWSDILGSDLGLSAGTRRVDVQFVHGQVNFCSISMPLSPTFVVPFDKPALDYYDVTGPTTIDHVNSCRPGPVDSKPTSDATCNARGAECYVAFTEPGETLIYSIEARRDLKANLKFRLASNGNNKRIRVSIDGGPSTELVAPNEGWESFRDRTIENVDLSKGFHLVEVEFRDGVTNLCSFSAAIA